MQFNIKLKISSFSPAEFHLASHWRSQPQNNNKTKISPKQPRWLQSPSNTKKKPKGQLAAFKRRRTHIRSLYMGYLTFLFSFSIWQWSPKVVVVWTQNKHSNAPHCVRFRLLETPPPPPPFMPEGGKEQFATKCLHWEGWGNYL